MNASDVFFIILQIWLAANALLRQDSKTIRLAVWISLAAWLGFSAYKLLGAP